MKYLRILTKKRKHLGAGLRNVGLVLFGGASGSFSGGPAGRAALSARREMALAFGRFDLNRFSCMEYWVVCSGFFCYKLYLYIVALVLSFNCNDRASGS